MSSQPGPPPLPAAREDAGMIEAMSRMFRDIVGRAALSLPGVAALSPLHGVLRRRTAEGVQVILGRKEVTLSVSLTVRHEAVIPDLTADLRRRVTADVEQRTGYRVRAFHVTIENILPPESPQHYRFPTSDRIGNSLDGRSRP